MEMCIGIICACLANFKPFFRRYFPQLLGSTNRSDACPTGFSRTANTSHTAPISGYELQSPKGYRKSGMPQKNREQSCTINESQEDILGDEFLKNMGRTNVEATTPDARPSQKGSFLSDGSNALPVPREEF